MTASYYVSGGVAARMARQQLRRDVVGFIAYHVYMAIPTWLPFKWFLWMLPSVGDWSERDARWTFMGEGIAALAQESVSPSPVQERDSDA